MKYKVVVILDADNMLGAYEKAGYRLHTHDMSLLKEHGIALEIEEIDD